MLVHALPRMEREEWRRKRRKGRTGALILQPGGDFSVVEWKSLGGSAPYALVHRYEHSIVQDSRI